MKSISITGKRNTDKIKSLENPDMIFERNSMKKFSKDIIIFYENHLIASYVLKDIIVLLE